MVDGEHGDGDGDGNGDGEGGGGGVRMGMETMILLRASMRQYGMPYER